MLKSEDRKVFAGSILQETSTDMFIAMTVRLSWIRRVICAGQIVIMTES